MSLLSLRLMALLSRKSYRECDYYLSSSDANMSYNRSSIIANNAAYGYGSYDATTTAAAAMAKETMMMGESSSAKMMAESSSKKMMDESTSTMMAEATSAAAAIVATTTSVMYGSGSSTYGSGYDNCVQRAYILHIQEQV